MGFLALLKSNKQGEVKVPMKREESEYGMAI